MCAQKTTPPLSTKEKIAKWWRETKPSIWNPEKKEFIGRGAKSWAAILSCNVVYYAIVCGFFAMCFAIFSTTLNYDVPTLRYYMSGLKYSPALNYYPRPVNDSTLIIFTYDNVSSYSDRVQMLSSQLDVYRNLPPYDSINNVTLNCMNGVSSTYGQACAFDLPTYLSTTPTNVLVPNNQTNKCWDSESTSFGYSDGSPCIILRINRVFDWDPKPLAFNKTHFKCDGSHDTSNACLFENVASNLKSGIAEGYIPISCEGETDSDADYLLSATFNPPYGIPVEYFPYFNQPNYTSPPIMAQLTTTPGVLVMVWCRFWTNTVKHDVTDQQGSVHMEILQGNPVVVNVTSAATVADTTTTTTTTATSTVATEDSVTTRDGDVTTAASNTTAPISTRDGDHVTTANAPTTTSNSVSG